jgi:hypothetical protein
MYLQDADRVSKGASVKQAVLGKEAAMEYVEPNIVKLSNSNFQLEESWQDIRGFDVQDVEGDKIGSVEDSTSTGKRTLHAS